MSEGLLHLNDRFLDKAMDSVNAELFNAFEKFPWWPRDVFRGVAILNEEAGETTKAVLDYQYKDGPIDDIIKEAAQTGAMAIRLLQYAYYIKNIQEDTNYGQ